MKRVIPGFVILSLFAIFPVVSSASVVINEFLPNPVGADSGYEWIELTNNGASPIDLSGWSIEQATTGPWSTSFTFPSIVVSPSGYIVVGDENVPGADINMSTGTSLTLGSGGNGDGVRLKNNSGSVVDTVIYGPSNTDSLLDDTGSIAFLLAPSPVEGSFLTRGSDGVDTDDSSSDFIIDSVPTMGESNSGGGGGQTSDGLINYQGYLGNGSGNPVNGSVSMEFQLFDDVIAGSMVWGESYTTLTVVNGVYHVLLGSGTLIPPSTALDASIFANPNLWLQVKVNGEDLSPRQKLASVPYALQAGCNPGDFINCYEGNPAELGKGECKAGVRSCLSDGSVYGPCIGSVLPQIEVCVDGIDNDCDGQLDEIDCAVCGDNIVQLSEACDDGYTDDCGSCNATCSGPGSGVTCVAIGDIIFNEVLTDGTAAGDPNGDGTLDSTEDEFVEIINVSLNTIDLSGFKIVEADLPTPRHTFGAGTLLSPGEVIVVFGGGTPPADHTGAQYLAASNDDPIPYGLALNDAGDILRLVNPSDVVIAEFAYGTSGSELAIVDESSVRDPDGSGVFINHTSATGSLGSLFSPGHKIDGSNFP